MAKRRKSKRPSFRKPFSRPEFARRVFFERLEERQLLAGDLLYGTDALGNIYRGAPVAPGELPEPGKSDTGQPQGYPLSETFFLHSRPGATKTIYLDFNGHTTTGTAWNTNPGWNVDPIVTPAYDTDGNPASFSPAAATRSA